MKVTEMKMTFPILIFLLLIPLLLALGIATKQASAGDCMKLCKDSFWTDTNPTIADIEVEIAKGANINDANITGKNALHYAAYRSTPDIIQFLVDKGINLEVKESGDVSVPGGETPLHYAAYSRNPENVDVLLKAGANVNAQEGQKRTVLHFAVRKQLNNIITLLLNAGADASIKDDDGKSPFDYAKGDPEWIANIALYKRLKAASGE